MNVMIVLSLVLNILVLVPVTYGLLTGAAWTDSAYGPASPARGIVLAFYLAILIGSAGLLLRPVPEMVLALLVVQIIYKVLSAITVGTMVNPVVSANLAIAAFHSITAALIVWRAGA